MENDALDLGTHFGICLWKFEDNQVGYTVPQLISALETTTTLTTLRVYGDRYDDEPHVHRRVVEPLCQCLASLRLHNGHHPLQKVVLRRLDSDIVREFLVALKQFGICQVISDTVQPFPVPVHFFLDFCRDNSNLKVLELHHMDFTNEFAVDTIGDSATYLNLDKLILDHIKFKTSTAATSFAHLLTHMRVSDLQLGKLSATGGYVEYDEDSFEEYDDEQFSKRIVSGFKMPSVEQLTLLSDCRKSNIFRVPWMLDWRQ